MKKILIPIIVCLIVLVGSIAALQFTAENQNAAETANEINTAAGEETAVEPMAADAGEAQEVTEETTTTPSIDINPRVEDGHFVIGANDAPVTITEFSSLSCPHCAEFHKTTLPSLKKDYVETGKVKFVFRDFPLNPPAIQASLLLKCVDMDDRYEFMEMLFNQQTDWALTDTQNKLKQYASLIGIPNDKAEACMTDEGVAQSMFMAMREGAQKYEVDSTPSFIVTPGDDKLVGAQRYGAFSTRIEEIVNK